MGSACFKINQGQAVDNAVKSHSLGDSSSGNGGNGRGGWLFGGGEVGGKGGGKNGEGFGDGCTIVWVVGDG